MSWAAGHCRTCEGPEFSFSESIGVPGQLILDHLGHCPGCGVDWSLSPEVCHVCGGEASPGSWWESLGFDDPGPLPEAETMEMAVAALEVEPSETGALSRSELDRIMAALYPSPGSVLTYYRQAWRAVLGDHLWGSHAGRDRQREDERLEQERKAKRG